MCIACNSSRTPPFKRRRKRSGKCCGSSRNPEAPLLLRHGFLEFTNRNQANALAFCCVAEIQRPSILDAIPQNKRQIQPLPISTPRPLGRSKEQGMSVYDRLKAMNISLPVVEPPVAAFVPVVRTGNLAFVSGHIAKENGKAWAGKLGENLTTEQGKTAARGIAIELLATLHAAAGHLNKITRIVKLLVLANSAPNFTQQHLVANGASELLVEVFGEKGPQRLRRCPDSTFRLCRNRTSLRNCFATNGLREDLSFLGHRKLATPVFHLMCPRTEYT